jgi:hypothetical protein
MIRETDELSPAKGFVLGTVLGLGFWAAVALAWWLA